MKRLITIASALYLILPVVGEIAFGFGILPAFAGESNWLPLAQDQEGTRFLADANTVEIYSDPADGRKWIVAAAKKVPGNGDLFFVNVNLAQCEAGDKGELTLYFPKNETQQNYQYDGHKQVVVDQVGHAICFAGIALDKLQRSRAANAQ